MKILHVITGLNIGGAETVLYNLVSSQNDKHSIVVSLTSLGNFGQDLAQQGITVVALELKFYNLPLVICKLYKLIRQHKPTIVQTWLYHADLIGGISAKLAGVRLIIWGIRTTELKRGSYLTTIIRKILAYLSYWIPTKIILNAERAREKHSKLGYDTSKMLIIPKGFNIQNFDVKPQLVADFKKIFSIMNNDFVIGCVGRLSQVKGQDIFIKSAGIILQSFPNTKFLMVGRGLEAENQEILSLIEKNADLNNFILIGERNDVPVCLNAMDIFCVPSRSEGFPNTLGEAMLAGVPCVSTDAGDASILGGIDVPIARVDDPEDLASKLIEMMNNSNKERQLIGQRLSQRIIDEYSLDIMISRFRDFYGTL